MSDYVPRYSDHGQTISRKDEPSMYSEPTVDPVYPDNAYEKAFSEYKASLKEPPPPMVAEIETLGEEEPLPGMKSSFESEEVPVHEASNDQSSSALVLQNNHQDESTDNILNKRPL